MDKSDQQAQNEAANILLDLGVSIPMPAPRLLRWFGIKKIRLTIRRPYWGTLIRISRIWLSMGITAETIKNNRLEDDLIIMRDHGKDVSKIVAYGILRGWFSGMFAGMLGRVFLWKVHPFILVEAAYKLVTLSRVEDFMSTIRSIGTMNVMRNLSPEVKGS